MALKFQMKCNTIPGDINITEPHRKWGLDCESSIALGLHFLPFFFFWSHLSHSSLWASPDNRSAAKLQTWWNLFLCYPSFIWVSLEHFVFTDPIPWGSTPTSDLTLFSSQIPPSPVVLQTMRISFFTSPSWVSWGQSQYLHLDLSYHAPGRILTWEIKVWAGALDGDVQEQIWALYW